MGTIKTISSLWRLRDVNPFSYWVITFTDYCFTKGNWSYSVVLLSTSLHPFPRHWDNIESKVSTKELVFYPPLPIYRFATSYLHGSQNSILCNTQISQIRRSLLKIRDEALIKDKGSCLSFILQVQYFLTATSLNDQKYHMMFGGTHANLS